MRLAVARQLMPLLDDFSHEPRIAHRDPAQREESRACAAVVEQPQQPLDVALDPTLHLVPAVPFDVRRERRNLEIVLDVDRQRVDDAARAPIGASVLPVDRARMHRHFSRALRRPVGNFGVHAHAAGDDLRRFLVGS